MAFSLNFYTKHGSLLRFYSCSRTRNPYDVLGLKQTCSSKDVKKAYIKLCKECHPDMKPGDESLHKKFIELNDAYTTLIGSDNKRQNVKKNTHDETNFSWQYQQTTHTSQNEKKSDKAWYESEEYQEYVRRRDKKHQPNKKFRIANLWVVTGCFILMIIGSALYITAYSYAYRYKNATVDEKSRKISENYYDVRQNALVKGSVKQLHNLQKKWND